MNNNVVAKLANKFNKATVFKDKKKRLNAEIENMKKSSS